MTNQDDLTLGKSFAHSLWTVVSFCSPGSVVRAVAIAFSHFPIASVQSTVPMKLSQVRLRLVRSARYRIFVAHVACCSTIFSPYATCQLPFRSTVTGWSVHCSVCSAIARKPIAIVDRVRLKYFPGVVEVRSADWR